jgi:hypothetical protein
MDVVSDLCGDVNTSGKSRVKRRIGIGPVPAQSSHGENDCPTCGDTPSSPQAHRRRRLVGPRNACFEPFAASPSLRILVPSSTRR